MQPFVDYASDVDIHDRKDSLSVAASKSSVPPSAGRSELSEAANEASALEAQSLSRSERRLSVTKRVFDVAAGLVLAVASSPLVVLLALVSLLRFRATPFFVQDRIGLGGSTIRCVKIRTLSPAVPAYLDKAALLDAAPAELWARVVRRLHLDELPQFWQVVGGTMSLVGPRPMIPGIIDQLPTEVSDVRHQVRPGVTGAWQISIDGSTQLDDSCDYDLAYVRSQSLLLDVRILLWTAAQAVGAAKLPKERVFKLLGSQSDGPRDAVTGAAARGQRIRPSA